LDPLIHKQIQRRSNWFSSSVAGVLSEIRLEQWGTGQVKPTESARLTCAAYGTSVDGNNWSWIRQPPGRGLEWLGVIWRSGETGYSSGIKGRISITRDSSKGQVYLQLNNMKAADTAKYYCARWHSDTKQQSAHAKSFLPRVSSDPAIQALHTEQVCMGV
uniref:Ig-like domain-containing protein n=1 Tax=Chelydra serpentina TaxID=8475 RepID=A0A8C3RZ41_CHESE